MKAKLLEKANWLVEEYNKILLDAQAFSFGIGSPREVISRKGVEKLRARSEKLAKEYADYIRLYNTWLMGQKRHTPEIHNLKHQFDIVSSMKSQVAAILGDREEKANLYLGAYFNTISILVALAAIIIALVFGIMV